jgi:hypothetical protein
MCVGMLHRPRLNGPGTHLLPAKILNATGRMNVMRPAATDREYMMELASSESENKRMNPVPTVSRRTE